MAGQALAFLLIEHSARLDQDGDVLLQTPITLNSANYDYGGPVNIIQLSDGNLAVFWSEMEMVRNGHLPPVVSQEIEVQIFNQEGGAVMQTPLTITNAAAAPIDVITLSDGNIAVLWNDSGIKAQILDQNGNSILAGGMPVTIAGSENAPEVRTGSFAELSDGSIAIFWNSADYSSTSFQILDQNGNCLPAPITVNNVITGFNVLPNGGLLVYWDEEIELNPDDWNNPDYTGELHYVDEIKGLIFNSAWSATATTLLTLNDQSAMPTSVTQLPDGDIVVFFYGTNGYNAQIVDLNGNQVPIGELTPPAQDISLKDLGNTLLTNPYFDIGSFSQYASDQLFSLSSVSDVLTNDDKAVSPIFKSLLNAKSDLDASGQGQIDPALIQKLVNDALAESGLAAITDNNSKEMNVAMMLAEILKNPNDDQKKLLDVVESMMNEVSKTENTSPELQKAENDMLEAVAKILLAQAIPDLLKEGDISNIKGLFKELTEKKDAIMSTYQEATKPYFEAIKDLLTKNMGVVTNSGIVSKEMLEKELSKASPNDLEKILEKLRAKPNKTKDEEAILQAEAGYREKYLEPGKKLLEEEMKTILKEFANKINTALEGKKK